MEDEGPTVKIGSLPVQFIPKGIATPGLVALIILSKYEDALPLISPASGPVAVYTA